MTIPNLSRINLPKWPQMIVLGNQVTVDQAKEVIRRTDIFFTWPWGAGNSEEYRNSVISTLGMPKLVGPLYPHKELDKWLGKWGFIYTNYVYNNWIASSYIYGPCGWMHPSGKIAFCENVGRWPSAEQIHIDWCILAREFPFVTADVLLMSGEHIEEGTHPVIGMHIGAGEVEIFDPVDEPNLSLALFNSSRLMNQNRKFLPGENGIQAEWIKEWGKGVK